jgi:hypothetical protein
MMLVMSYIDEDSDEVIEGAQALYMPEGVHGKAAEIKSP